MMSSVTQPPPRLVQPVSIEVMEGKVCVETPIDVSHRLRQSSLFSDYRFREETIEDDEEMFPEPSLRPTIPLWFMPLVAANVFTIVVAGIERSYVKRSWSRRNFAFLHSKPYRLFYREVEMYKAEEKLRGYVVLGLFYAAHHRCRRVWVAQCPLLPKDRVQHEKEFGKDAKFVLLRILLTMCDNPRTDFVVLNAATSHVEIWQGTSHIRHYECDLDGTYNSGHAEHLLREHYAQHNLIYDPARLVKRIVNPAKHNLEIVGTHESFKFDKTDDTDAMFEDDDESFMTLVSKAEAVDKNKIQGRQQCSANKRLKWWLNYSLKSHRQVTMLASRFLRQKVNSTK